MTTLKTNWGKHAVTLTWVEASEPPEGMTVSSTHGFCFLNGKVLLVNLDKRGWDIPGGHTEDGETPEECFAREAMEEACVSGTSRIVGYTLVDNREDVHRIPGKYPDIGVQVFYRMDVDELLPFAADFESTERALVDPDEVSQMHASWNEIFEEVFKVARREK